MYIFYFSFVCMYIYIMAKANMCISFLKKYKTTLKFCFETLRGSPGLIRGVPRPQSPPEL